MRATVRPLPLALSVAGLLLALFLLTVSALGAEGVTRRLVPIGASYQVETLELFAAQAIAATSDGVVTIRVLPIAYATDPYSITQQERQENLALAQNRAQQIQDACTSLTGGAPPCVATVPDIQVRSDAQDPTRVAELGPGVEGIYILGGDQQVAMRVVANTPTEDALEARYNEGAAVGGNSAGAAVVSRYMIGGYTGDNWPWHGLQYGSVDLWYGATDTVTRGLRFGLDEAIVDQHVLERGRIARLLQAAQRSPGPKVGLGLDWGTGAVVLDEQVVTETRGYYATVVLDEETYGAAAGAQYLGPSQTLSIHDVAFHVLPEGPYGYDLVAQRPIVSGTVDATPPDVSDRAFGMLDAPSGAGTLLLTGDIGEQPTGAVASRFATLAQASGGPTVVLAAGFITETHAIAAANGWAATLGGLGVTAVQTATLNESSDLNALAAQLGAAGAIFVTGDDQPTMAARVPLLAGDPVNLPALWLGGTPLLLDNAAAAAAGEWMSAEPTPTGDTLEYQSSDSFGVGYVDVQPAMGLLPGAVFEPRVLYDYLYGRLVSHIYEHPDVVAFGIERGAAIEVTPDEATVLGPTAVLVVDGRLARVQEEGANGIIGATWLLLDTFTAGETIFSGATTAVSLSLFDATPTPDPLGAVLVGTGLALAGLALWRRRSR